VRSHAIKGERIAAVGRIAAGAGAREIDAKGLYVTPGFIDPHSHAWPALSRSETAPAKALLTQGVTTVLLNPDGGGPTDLPAQRRAIEAMGPAVNAALFIGHNSARSAVMGRANRDPDEPAVIRGDQRGASLRRGFRRGWRAQGRGHPPPAAVRPGHHAAQ
jgi:N-acyl-D-aspartate/D-glutamate deacylase